MNYNVKSSSIRIHIPKDLKCRMDKHNELNWSAIAQEAFKVAMKLPTIESLTAENERIRRYIRQAAEELVENAEEAEA